MMNIPILIEPEALQATLSDSQLLVVDLSKAATYANGISQAQSTWSTRS